MIFGMIVSPTLLLVLGLTLFALLVMQILVGMRKIKLGRKTWMYHKYIAYAMLGIAIVHGFLGVLLAYGFRVF